MEVFLKGTMKNGELIIKNHESVRQILAQYDDKELVISVKIFDTKPSRKQLGWYWGVAVQRIIQEHKKKTGESLSKEEVHAFNICEIVKPKLRTKEVMGKTIIEIEEFSISGMNKREFGTFKQNLQAYWIERDVDIPDPGEEDFANDKQKDQAYESLNRI